MSEELKLKFRALGLLSASAIGGEACKDCPHNIPRMSAALLTGDGEALRDCAKLLFKDCELLPLGTKARITELEQQLSEKITGENSDGYHTFNELYHHRAVLFSVICRCFPERSWKSRKHHDGTMYSGMFIVGIETDNGQATYHYDIEPYWDMFPVKELKQAPEWDGHTPQEAIERIGKMQIRPFAELEQENRDQLIDYENRLCEARKYQQDAVRWCEELEAERDRLREALNLIGTKADFCADECEYGPDATSFRLIADDAKRALKGAEQEVE